MQLTFDVHVIGTNSFILFLTVQRIVHSRHIIGHQMFKYDAIHVDVIGTRFGRCCFANTSCIFHGEYEGVLIVKFLHIGTRLPRLHFATFFLLHDSKNALFSECGVQCKDAHQCEIRCDTCNQNGSEYWMRSEKKKIRKLIRDSNIVSLVQLTLIAGMDSGSPNRAPTMRHRQPAYRWISVHRWDQSILLHLDDPTKHFLRHHREHASPPNHPICLF